MLKEDKLRKDQLRINNKPFPDGLDCLSAKTRGRVRQRKMAKVLAKAQGRA